MSNLVSRTAPIGWLVDEAHRTTGSYRLSIYFYRSLECQPTLRWWGCHQAGGVLGQGGSEGGAGEKIQAGPQLRDWSRIGVIRYKYSGFSPSVWGTMSPGLRGSLSLKRTFSEFTAETPSSRYLGLNKMWNSSSLVAGSLS